MNAHAPQSIKSEIELRLICSPKMRIISPRTSAPAVGAKQDSLLGSYLMAHDTTFIKAHNAMNILMKSYNKLDNGIEKNKTYSGKYVFSQIIPKDINMIITETGKNGIYKNTQPDDIIKSKERNKEVKFMIKNGIIEKGIIEKSQIGTGRNGLIHKIWNTVGIDQTQEFIDDMQRIVIKFLERRGFTISIKDAVPSKELRKTITDLYTAKKLEVECKITEYQNNTDVYDIQTFEQDIANTISSYAGSDVVKLVMKTLNLNNGFFVTISSKSNGSETHAGQIIGMIGQMTLDGSRIKEKMNGRALPQFTQFDPRPSARGFIDKPYVRGCNPYEFFFNVITGRDGVIATAVKTADTGYTQRKLVKTMEDLIFQNDGTVRNADGRMIQFIYGDVNIHPEKQTDQQSYLIHFNNQEVIDALVYTEQELKEFKKTDYTKELNDKLYKKYIIMRDKMREINSKLNKFGAVSLEDKYLFPVDLYQIILNEIVNSKETKNTVDPFYVIEKLNELLDITTTPLVSVSKNLSKYKMKIKDDKDVKLVFRFIIYDYLSPKRCTHQYKIGKDIFDKILEKIRITILRAKVEPGENVGVLAAQSIGQPTTQMTLNTFHRAGMGAKMSSKLTGELPRLKEIISATANIKTPYIQIFLNDDIKSDEKMAKNIAYKISHTVLIDIADTVEVIYDPKPLSKNSLMNKEDVKDLFGCQLHLGEVSMDDLDKMPWVIKVKLNREKMYYQEMTISEMKIQLCQQWNKLAKNTKGLKKHEKAIFEKISQSAILSNDDSSINPTIHIRIGLVQYNYDLLIAITEKITTQVKLKGLEGMIDVGNLEERKYITYNEDGTVDKNKTEYTIMVMGNNMTGIRKIKGINLERSYTNDIKLTKTLFGIEAARSLILRELQETMSNDNSGGYQHMALLSDAMCFTGDLTAINRNGISKLETGVLSRASFEKTTEQFVDAAVFSEKDHTRSVSSCIITGKVVKEGTGHCSIELDTSFLDKLETDVKETQIKSSIKKSSFADALLEKKKNKSSGGSVQGTQTQLRGKVVDGPSGKVVDGPSGKVKDGPSGKK